MEESGDDERNGPRRKSERKGERRSTSRKHLEARIGSNVVFRRRADYSLAALHIISSLSSSAFTLTEASTLYYFAQPYQLNIAIVYLSNQIWQRLLHRTSKFQGILYIERTPYTASFECRNSTASRWWTTLQLRQRH